MVLILAKEVHLTNQQSYPCWTQTRCVKCQGGGGGGTLHIVPILCLDNFLPKHKSCG